MTEDEQMREAFDEEWARAHDAYQLLGASEDDIAAHRFTARQFFELGWKAIKD